MLSFQHCRELLGAEGIGLSDDELAAMRDELYSLAALTIDAATNKLNRAHLRLVNPNEASSSGPGFSDALNLLSNDQKGIIEERAAILEYDANLSRDEAERAAIAMSIHREES